MTGFLFQVFTLLMGFSHRFALTPQESDLSIPTLGRMLKAKEDQAKTLRAVFEIRSADRVNAEYSTRQILEQLAREKPTHQFDWAENNGQYAFSLQAPPESGNSITGIWNGITFETQKVEAKEKIGGIPADSRKIDKLYSISAGNNDFYDSFRPHKIMEHPVRRWSDILLQGSKIKILGKEEIGGRNCLKILFDNGPVNTLKDQYLHPEVFWIDIDSPLIVLRWAILFRSNGDPPPLRFGREHSIEGNKYREKYIKEITKISEVRPGLYLPCEVIRIRENAESRDGLHAELFSFDEKSWQLGRDVPNERFNMRPLEGSKISDGRTGQVQLMENGKVVDTYLSDFRNCLQKIAASDGVANVGKIKASLRRQNNCGSMALSFAALLYGVDTSPDEIAEYLPSGERDSVHSSVGSLATIARKLHLNADVIKVDDISIIRKFPKYFLALVRTPRSSSAETSTHFAVASSLPNQSVRLVSPPENPVFLSEDNFHSMWTGYAVLVSNQALDQTVISPPIFKYFVSALLLITGALGFLTAIRLRRRNI